MLVVLPTPPFWLATVSIRRRDGPRHPVPVRVQHPGRALRLLGDRRPAPVFHVKRRLGSRAVLAPQAPSDTSRSPSAFAADRSTTTTVLGGSTMPTPHVRSAGSHRPSRRRRGRPARPRRGADALHGEHRPTRAQQRKAPRGQPGQRSDCAGGHHVGSLPSPPDRDVLGSAPLHLDGQIRDRRPPRATTRPGGRAAPRERSADPAGPAPTVSRAVPRPTRCPPPARRPAPARRRPHSSGRVAPTPAAPRAARAGPVRPRR